MKADSTNDERTQNAIDDLVLANHILSDQGILDGFGHVSVRHPSQPDRFMLARSMAPALVSAGDLILYDLDGTPIDANGKKSYVERFIHSEIYQARPDVMAVVHSHSIAVVPFAVSTVRLRPVCHMCGFLANVPNYDIRTASGRMTDMLVRDAELGRQLAQLLRDESVALMRGHGFVAVGGSIQEAVYRSIYTEVNARIQSDAIRLGGEVTYLHPEEAALAERSNAAQYDRPWQLWKKASVAKHKGAP